MSTKAFTSLFLLILLAGCNEGTEITRTLFESTNKTWPLTVEGGFVTCSHGSAIFFEDDNGRRFVVNGNARDKEPSLPHLDEITAVNQKLLRIIRAAGDTDPFEPRLDAREIINLGMSIC